MNKESYKRPEVSMLVDFYMENGPELTNEVGYVSSDADVYEQNKNKLK